MMRLMPSGTNDVRRFACTACGRCCDRAPELELSEAAALAGTFILSVIFKVHSLPVSERAGTAAQWWRAQGSRIPLRPALEEHRRHLSQFASRRRSDNLRGRQTFLTISAVAQDDQSGHCPALANDRCAIYANRPLTCRTVPLHYSRPPSTLRDYLDRFTMTPGYRCDTTPAAPIVLDGNVVTDQSIQAFRQAAIERARMERAWKEHMLGLMDNSEAARIAQLPTYEAVLTNSDNGYATTLPMIVAWRVARAQGLLPVAEFNALCRQQIGRIDAEIARCGEAASGDLRDTLALYEQSLVETPGAALRMA